MKFSTLNLIYVFSSALTLVDVHLVQSPAKLGGVA